jgi:hypothetical protein
MSDKTIVFPYAFTNDTTAYADQVQANLDAVRTAFNSHRHNDVVYDVKSSTYGAVGDGTTDDYAAIQAAINACNTAGGGIVFIPAGTYRLLTALTLKSNVRLHGTGAASVLKSGAAGVSAVTTAVSGSVTNAEVADLKLDLTGESTVSGALLQDGSDVEVRRVIVVGGRWGIQMKNMTRGFVSRCDVSAQDGAAIPVGIYFSGTSTSCTAERNYVHDLVGALGGLGIFFDSTSSTQTRLDHKALGNTVYNVADNGIRFQTNPSQPLQGFYVCDGNLVVDATVDQIRVNGYGATITANVCVVATKGQAGIRDTGAGSTTLSKATIAANVCINLTGAPTNGGIELHAGSSDCTIDNNYCEGFSQGINLLGVRYALSGNLCYANKEAGIFLQGVTDSVVAGGIMRNNGWGVARAGVECNSTCLHITVTGVRAFDDQTPKTQPYGFKAAAGADYLQLIGNDFTGNLTGAYTMPSTANNLVVSFTDQKIVFGETVLLEREASGKVRIPDAQLRVQRSSGATAQAIVANVAGDAAARFQLLAGGKMQWGDGTSGVDTTLYRSAADELTTDDALKVTLVLSALGGLSIADGTDVTIGTTTGSKIGQAGSKLGFFGAAAIVKPGAYTQTYATADKTHANPTAAALTDNTAGAANTTLQALPDPADTPATADALRDDVVANLIPALRNNYADLAASNNAIIADLADLKQLVNSIIDDLQALGLVG